MCAKYLYKAVSLSLSFLLMTQSFVFAAGIPAKKSREEIKVMLTAPDKYISKAGIGGDCVWAIAVLAAGAIGYKAGHFIGDIRGFGRGYKVRPMAESEALIKSQAEFIKSLEKEIANLSRQLAKSKALNSQEDKAVRLVVRLNSQIAALKERKMAAETEKIKKSIAGTIDELYKLEFKDPSTKRVMGKFLDQASKSIGKKGILLAIASLFASIAAVVLLSGAEDKYPVSTARLAVTRQLKAASVQGPQALALTALNLKKQYGADIVASVIYENQASFLPSLEKQLSAFANEDNRAAADYVLAQMSETPQSNKNTLLESLQGKTSLKYNFVF